MYLRDVHALEDLSGILADEKRVSAMREGLLAGDAFVVRKVVDPGTVASLRSYLEGIARYSLPNYRRIEPGCPNFHRIDRWDPRAHVGACVHSFSFFPWNHDVLGLFDLFRPVYRLKNRLSGLAPDSFLGTEPDRGCTARISFQYYPRGIGGIHRHQDPLDYHQITVPALTMSLRGVDFERGGAYLEKSATERAYLDDLCDLGDVTFFHASSFHGVERIDPEAKPDWLSFRGRWMCLFAVNKVTGNEAIGDSVDLERDGA